MLRFSAACSSLTLLAFALAGCGGGGAHSSLVPATNGGQSATSPPSKLGNVVFTIIVPKESASTLAHRPAYISPATQSMTVNITGTGGTANPSGFPQTVALTPTSTGCTSSLASTTCTLQLSLAAGKYAASISTFDGANGAGNELSTNQGVAFTVTASTTNAVPLTLSGIPAQIDPSYLGSGKFMVVALDADSNYIVGAGAPTFTVAKSSGSSVAAITQPTTAAPNAFSLAATTTTGSETMTITAGYPAGETSGCTQAGAVCTTNFSISNNQYLFALNYGDDNVLGYSVPFTSSSQTPALNFADFGDPYGPSIALDSNGNLFFAGGYDYSEPVYEVAAGYAGTPVSLFSLYGSGLAFDSKSDLFASSYTSGTIGEYALPYTGGTINSFTTSSPWFIALDTNNDLFVANYDASYVTEYPYSSGSYGSAVQIDTDAAVYTLWFDPSGDLWVGAGTTIQEFKPSFSSSSTAAVTITGAEPEEYCPGTFDSSGDLIIQYSTSSSSSIDEYKAATISANQGGGTISSPDVTVPGAGEYACVIGIDAANNLYVSTYEGPSATDGGIYEYALPLTNASTPVYTVTSGVSYPYGAGVITKSVQLSVTL